MQKNCLSYPVELAADAFGESETLAKTLFALGGGEMPKVLIVVDQNVVQRVEGLGLKIGRYVQAHGLRLAGSPVVIAGGEKAKVEGWQNAQTVISAALAAKLGRRDVVLAMGGGAILDLAGYAAAQVRGGVQLVRMPTTPPAMLGAAYAEYAAIDCEGIKDALRVTSKPAAVVIDPQFASTVMDGVWRGGFSEAVRYAVAKDSTLFKKLGQLSEAYHSRSAEALREVAELVMASRKKKGPSDFAFWEALRLEALSGYKLPHGPAVAIGIMVECAYALAQGAIKEKDMEAVKALLAPCGVEDVMMHSRHLLTQSENLMYGLDAWLLTQSEPVVERLDAIGKSAMVASPSRETYAAAFREFCATKGKTACA